MEAPLTGSTSDSANFRKTYDSRREIKARLHPARWKILIMIEKRFLVALEVARALPLGVYLFSRARSRSRFPLRNRDVAMWSLVCYQTRFTREPLFLLHIKEFRASRPWRTKLGNTVSMNELIARERAKAWMRFPVPRSPRQCQCRVHESETLSPRNAPTRLSLITGEAE